MSDRAPVQLDAWMESVRRSGGWRLDPPRFRYMEALARRMAGQQVAARSLLEARLQAAAADYAARLAAAQPASGGATGKAAAAPATPLAQLNAYLRATAEARLPPASPGEFRDEQELASARRFRAAWDRNRSLDQVEKAVARKPVAAGPLNSHALLLQSLDLMRELSPDYLRRFLVHAETLQWLAQAREKYLAADGRKSKPAATARRKRKP